jgi:hypothetical protein
MRAVSLRNILFVFIATAACGHKSPNETGAGSATTAKTDLAKAEPAAGSAADTDKPKDVTPPPEPAVKPTEPADKPTEPADKPTEPADKPTEPEADAFAKLARDEKIKIMKTQVMPAMAKAFKGFNAKKFAKFNCKSCHGKGASDETFKMPNPDLPALDFAALKAGKQAPKMAEFMGKTVNPEMAKLLKLPEFDPAHAEAGGFGCLACHVMKK